MTVELANVIALVISLMSIVISIATMVTVMVDNSPSPPRRGGYY